MENILVVLVIAVVMLSLAFAGIGIRLFFNRTPKISSCSSANKEGGCDCTADSCG